jgi:hypothetical protein
MNGMASWGALNSLADSLSWTAQEIRDDPEGRI